MRRDLNLRIQEAGYKLVLGSRSPRRRELLAAAGFDFEVVAPSASAEEVPQKANRSEAQGPAELVGFLAERKAADVARRVQRSLVVGCDTVAACGGLILGKPADASDARRMLTTLSGRRHRVLSGLCLWPVGGDRNEKEQHCGRPLLRVETTLLEMQRLSEAQLDEYIHSGLWRGKAGSFGYQDALGWVRVVEGSESNVVGLPMELLGRMLDDFLSGYARA